MFIGSKEESSADKPYIHEDSNLEKNICMKPTFSILLNVYIEQRKFDQIFTQNKGARRLPNIYLHERLKCRRLFI